MKQQAFEELNQPLWLEVESVLNDSKGKPGADFPRQYRALCQQLAVAKSRRYTSHLIDRLNRLVVEAHHVLYRRSAVSQSRWLWFLVYGFPSVIRRNKSYVLWASILFYLPLIAMGTACFVNEDMIYSIMDPDAVRNFDSMYDPGNESIGRERDSETDLAMFGFYIKNNVGIGFRTFAGGMLFGVGAIFFLIFNGISIGGVGGYLTQIGYIDTFYGFVVGHSAFELTAIVFCGAAGLKLGLKLLDPGPLKRVDAVRLAGREAILIVYGAALMLVIAAFIEAFWSSTRSLPLVIKYSFGAAMAIMLLSYFCFSGRRYES
ncbi:stage II sporulation protein M [Halioxenophilus sp. WMMB6]|uniref:stage II sporulation protein M n=1 Tax=Halioxenophilus sp. WMMB6 TaxID=3073815 RepID=UPI00295F2168|nr:stage II sporulation protein M [Halioxenophilus sp. WMMB6]